VSDRICFRLLPSLRLNHGGFITHHPLTFYVLNAEYERESQVFEENERVKRMQAEELLREMERVEKERLERQHREIHLMEEERIREKLMHDKEEAAKRLAEANARKEKARRGGEEKERLLREKKERKEQARLERQRKEEELRARCEAEKKEREEAARREFEREKLEREKAKRELLEQRRKALEEKQKARRAERLKRIKAEQERVEMQVKKVTQHPGSGHRKSELADQLERERVSPKDPKREPPRQADQTNGKSGPALTNERALAAQRQKEEARRLMAEAERLKMRLTAEKAKTSNKAVSSSSAPKIKGPTDRKKSTNAKVEAELLNWVSKKQPSTTKIQQPRGKAKVLVQSNSDGSETKPPRKSKLSQAVAQVAKEKHSSTNAAKPPSGKAKEVVRKSAVGSETKSPPQSSLSAAVARAAKEKDATTKGAKSPSGKVKAVVRKSAVGSETIPTHQSDFSAAAVTQVAKQRSAKSVNPNIGKKNSSRLSLAVAAAAQQRPNTTPKKPTKSKPVTPAVDEAKLEIMNWLQNKK